MSGSPLHPSQFPPLPHSPEAVSKPHVSSPIFPSSPWVFGKKDILGLSPDNHASTMINLESSSMTMDISLTTVFRSLKKDWENFRYVLQQKDKDIDFIYAQYTILSAKTKRTTSPTTAILFGTIANPKNAITTHPVIATWSSKELSSLAGQEILSNPCSESTKVTPTLPVAGSLPADKVKPPGSVGSAEAFSPMETNSQNLLSKDPQTSGNYFKHCPSYKTYAEKAKVGTDRSLKRLAPLAFSPEGIP